MRYLFYYRSNGALIFKYKDEFGKHITHRYIFYSYSEALKLFREQYGLKYKKIHIQKLNEEDKK